jgi:hypothetical protein
MFGSTVLEVAVGLVLVYLLVSLICSQVSDKISEALNWRARDLEAGIRDILLGDKQDTLVKDIFGAVEVKQFNRIFAPLTAWALKMPLLKNRVFLLNQDLTAPDFGPVTIPVDAFTRALIRALVPNDTGVTSLADFKTAVETKMQPSPLKDVLVSLASQTTTKVDDIRAQIGSMYNRAEDQMTAFYRRHMWGVAFGIGLIVSALLNVDSIAIGFGLWRDPSLRAAVNQAAAKYASDAQPQQARETLDQLNLPIGWQVTSGAGQILGISVPRITPNDWVQEPRGVTPLGWLRDFFVKVIGWTLTAAAGAQGAPFWFDLLKRLTQRETTPPTQTQP